RSGRCPRGRAASVDLELRHELGASLLEGVEVDLLGVVGLVELGQAGQDVALVGRGSLLDLLVLGRRRPLGPLLRLHLGALLLLALAHDLSEGGSLSGHRYCSRTWGREQARLPRTPPDPPFSP